MKFVSELKLQYFKEKLLNLFALKVHTHTKSQISDMPTKLSQFTNDISVQGSTVTIVRW